MDKHTFISLYKSMGDMIEVMKCLKLPTTSTTQQYHLIFLSTKELTPEAIIINCIIILFIMISKSIFSLHAL